jgi:integrase
LAVLLGCGSRRGELIDLMFDHIQCREDHWAIVDLVGKGTHVRTVPMPDWVKETLDDWLSAADIRQGKLFRCVCWKGTVWGTEVTEKVVWHVVKEYTGRLGISKLAPHDLRSYAESRTMPNALISAGDSQAGGNKRFGIVRCATGLTYWGDETFR